MYLDDRTVEADRLDLDADQLLMLQLLERAIQHTGLRPAVHQRVDPVPVAKALGQRTPFAAVLGNIKNSVDHLQVPEAHIASLHRQELLDTIELRGGNFHAAYNITQCYQALGHCALRTPVLA